MLFVYIALAMGVFVALAAAVRYSGARTRLKALSLLLRNRRLRGRPDAVAA